MSMHRIMQQYLKSSKGLLGTNSIKCSPFSAQPFPKLLWKAPLSLDSLSTSAGGVQIRLAHLHSSKQLQISSGQHGEAPQGRAPNARPWRVSGNGQHEWKIRKVGKHTRASLGRRVYHVKDVISATLRELLGRRCRFNERV